MGLQNLFWGSDTEDDDTDDEPFVAANPWEWPDDEEYDFDTHDDDDVEYDFDWAGVGDDEKIYTMYREKIDATLTRFVVVSYPAAKADDEFIDEATAMHVLYYNQEQIWGDERTYEYVRNDDEPNEVDVSITCYNSTFEMPTTASNDLHLPMRMTENLAEGVIEDKVGGQE